MEDKRVQDVVRALKEADGFVMLGFKDGESVMIAANLSISQLAFASQKISSECMKQINMQEDDGSLQGLMNRATFK